MVMAVILESFPRCIGLGRVVDSSVVAGLLAGQWRVGCDDRAALLQVQMNLALEVN